MTQKGSQGLVAAILVCGLFALGLLLYGCVEWYHGYQVYRSSPPSNPPSPLGDLGNYGSYLQGTVASLWAAAGAFLILLGFLAQQQQLTLQRGQLKEQEEQFKSQFESTKRQSFESSF